MTWTRHGECNHCGHCCTMVSRDVLVRTPEQVQRDAAFYRARGFQPTRVDGELRYILFAWLQAPCPEFKDERCVIHDTKPQTCAEFPRLPVDIVGTPCSYWFERDGVRVGGNGSPHPTNVTQLLELEAVAG